MALILMTCIASTNVSKADEFTECSDMTIMDYPMTEHCDGFGMPMTKSCKSFIQNFVDSELPKLASQTVVIPKREHNNLACTPDVEVDDVANIVTLSFNHQLISGDKWLAAVKNSHNEILNYSIYSSLIRYGYDAALPKTLELAEGEDGDMPEDLKQTLAFSGSDLAVQTLIQVIKKHGYPKYRFGVGDLSYKKHPIWSQFLCDYYPQVRSPLRLLFGLGAPDDFSMKQRLQEWNKVKLDIQSMHTCSFWF